jgi:hypothetical protein
MDYLSKTSGFKNSSQLYSNLTPSRNEQGKTFTQTSNNYNYNSKSDKRIETEFVSKTVSERDSLIIANNLISNDDWDSIKSALLNSPNIHTIELSGISINDFGLRTLGEIIQHCAIKVLKLEWNYLNEHSEDFDYLCESLIHCNSLIYVLIQFKHSFT